jgi:hypothetical protein
LIENPPFDQSSAFLEERFGDSLLVRRLGRQRSDRKKRAEKNDSERR